MSFSQVFKGKNDQKLSVGFIGTDGGSGIQVTYDKGVGENISLGLSTNYLLGVSNSLDGVDTFDRFDAKGRFNVNLASVINVPNFDFYPGLNIGLHNFGMHAGARYFFTEGFGLYSEIDFPLAKYNNYSILENSFKFSVGVSLNLE